MRRVVVLMLGIALGPALADEKLAGIACRSVHLQWKLPEAKAVVVELTPERSAEGTYFCACGFSGGYFGLQEQSQGKKVAIFSVWDPGSQNDPKTVPEDRRVILVRQGDGVRIGRFGNEGTGGQSFLDLDWQADKTYRFRVTAERNGERAVYAGAVQEPDLKTWREVAAFSTITPRTGVRGVYSFVEDFRRNRVSLTHARAARFGPVTAETADGKRVTAPSAKFTGDANPATNIDAKRDGAGIRLATGGDTTNTGAKLNEALTLP